MSGADRGIKHYYLSTILTRLAMLQITDEEATERFLSIQMNAEGYALGQI